MLQGGAPNREERDRGPWSRTMRPTSRKPDSRSRPDPGTPVAKKGVEEAPAPKVAPAADRPRPAPTPRPPSQASPAPAPTRPPGPVKHFVLDTNVLLHNPNALFVFQDNHVIIPFAVIEELDKLKRLDTDIGRNARECIRHLDRLRARGRLIEGVEWGTVS